MSAMQRTRSVHKSTTASSGIPPTVSEPRNASPSRLPLRPYGRATSASITSSHAPSNVTRQVRAPSTGLTRTVSTRTSTRATTTEREPAKKDGGRYYPPTSSIARQPTTSKSRPTSSGASHPPTTRTVSSHLRAKSTATGPIAAAKPAPRPPSQNQAEIGKPVISQNIRPRAEPIEKAPSTPNPQQYAVPPLAAHVRLRPAFSTHQQHFSPARTTGAKPLTSAILAPPSPSKLPSNVVASAEANKLQIELLQLHLLHRDAVAVAAQWRLSAKTKLEERFAKLVAAEAKVNELEKDRHEGENIAALRRWGLDKQLDEKIQVLDAVVSGAWSLSEPGSKYNRLLQRFERWMKEVCCIEEQRSSKDSVEVHDGEAMFLSELDNSWKDDIYSIERRLREWEAQLHELGYTINSQANEATSTSSLSRIMDGTKGMIDNMLTEISVMEGIEQEAAAREEEWIARMSSSEHDYDTHSVGAIWRS